MKHLKTYKIFESSEDDIKSEVEDIFQHLIDLCRVKIKYHGSLSDFDNRKTLEVSINLDHLADNKSIVSKYGQEYRPVKNGEFISTELADAIDRCVNMLGMTIRRAELMWLNAGEWALMNKNKGYGPGSLSKIFTNDGIVGPIEGIIKSKYSSDLLPDFIIEKGDRVRNIKIIFSY